MKRNFLGASDAPTVMGLNPWKTRLQLWAEKTGKVEAPDLSDNQAVQWGKRLERICSARFAEKHGVKLMAYKKRFVHPQYDFISCELDNIIVGTEELVEIKTVNARAWKEWADPDVIPGYVIVQVMLQLGLSGRKVGWVFCLCGGSQEVEKRIEFDQELYDNLVAKMVEFWKMVQDETPPEPTAEDSKTLVDIYPRSGEDYQLVESLNTAIARRQELSGQIESMKEELKLVENQIKAVIGEALGIKTSQYVVSWKTQESTRLDTDAVKAAGMYEKFSKTSSTRVLRITNNKTGG
jgi:putative phage-type endonuclease